MREFLIRLRSVEEIRAFVSLATMQDCSVKAISGTRTTNAKSAMGMFNLDYEQPVRIVAEGEAAAEAAFYQAAAQYVVEE